ncbi:DUF1617 family protein [Lactococcus formosensis]|uniref:DUF1617 family protein n=1 Tax=Lactococcus formosensis TaxID=1281486 RepID=UPI0022E3BDAC|nr:DUF1617 family protein [Lactococcus formosensis]
MLKFKNNELVNVANFLVSIPLKSKASRARTALVQKMSLKNDEFRRFQKELLEKYAQKDDSGELIKDENGSYPWIQETKAEAVEALTELNNEEVYINIEEYRPNMKLLSLALDDLDVALSGQEAVAYNLLMDQLEEESEED